MTDESDYIIRQLQDEKENALDRVYCFKRTLLTVIRLARKPEDQVLDSALTSFKKLLGQDADLDFLEETLCSIKDKIIAFEMSGESGKAAAMPSEENKGEKWLARFKEAYLDLLGELDLDLGQDYLNRLVSLRNQVAVKDDFDSLLALHVEFESLVRFYAQQVF